MNNKKFKKIIILVLTLFISIGFAVLTENLGFKANLTFKENTFDVHFEKVEISNSSNSINNSINIDNTTTISFSTTLSKPTDYIDFTFYVVNSGTIDAKLNAISTNLTTDQNKYISYSFYYDIDDSEVKLNDYLYRGQARKIKAHFEYNYYIDSFYSGETLNTTLTLKYIQPENVTTTVWNYEYLGSEQYFIASKTGMYKLEVWGAQGGSYSDYIGGYGGYSTGTISLNKGTVLYINIGGEGKTCYGYNCRSEGGYNGGGDCKAYESSESTCGGGGGATHIGNLRGTLDIYEEKLSDLIIVSGGGGGAAYTNSQNYGPGGSGGGYIGVTPQSTAMDFFKNGYGTGGSQLTGGAYLLNANEIQCGSFGLGCSYSSGVISTTHISAGGGAGLYGGGASRINSAGGGSGYIGNTNLTDKIMYCYNCQSSEEEADETNIKTRSTINVSATPTSKYAKIGDGYARVTYIG